MENEDFAQMTTPLVFKMEDAKNEFCSSDESNNSAVQPKARSGCDDGWTWPVEFQAAAAQEQAELAEENEFLNLPDNVILHIMSFLNLSTLVRFSTTCKKLNELSETPSLWERLDLQGAFLKPGKLDFLAKRSPKYLRLARAKIAEPQPLKEDTVLLNMTYLDMSNVSIATSTLAAFLSSCKCLRKLSLESMPLGPKLFQHLCPSLEVLNLCMSSQLSLTDFCSYLLPNDSIHTLNIAWIQQEWTPTEFMRLINSLPISMLKLNISGYSKQMNNFHLAALVRNCPFLEQLDVSDNHMLGSNSIKSLVQLKFLKALAINRCCRIGLVALAPLRSLRNFWSIQLFGFTSKTCPAKVIGEWLKVGVNDEPFSTIGRPSSNEEPERIWGSLLFPLDTANAFEPTMTTRKGAPPGLRELRNREPFIDIDWN